MRGGLLWLWLIDAAIAVAVGFLWTQPASRWEPPAPILPAIAQMAQEETARTSTTLEQLRETTERPLFFAGRRPEAEEVASPVAVEAPADDTIEVSGFFSSPDGSGGAILKFNGETRRLVQGEEEGQWKLIAVDATSVQVQGADGSVRTVELVRAAQPAASASAPPRAASPVVPPGAPAGAPPGAGSPATEELQAKRTAYLRAVAKAREANRKALERARQDDRNR